jgi:acetyl-CoA acyltransferase 2
VLRQPRLSRFAAASTTNLCAAWMDIQNLTSNVERTIMSLAQKAVYIVGAKRTPFGAFGGKLKAITATDLAVHSSKAALAHANVAPEHVDETFFGNVIGSSLDSSYLSRHVALKSGVPVKSPSLTLNRLCGSGFETVCLGTEAIQQVMTH